MEKLSNYPKFTQRQDFSLHVELQSCLFSHTFCHFWYRSSGHSHPD